MFANEDAVDLQEALRMLEIPEEVLGRMIEQGKLKARPADGTIYFLREEIEKIAARQAEEVRSTEEP